MDSKYIRGLKDLRFNFSLIAIKMPVVPFQIAVPQPKIDRLIQKLLLTDFPDDVNSSEDSWARGVPLDDMKRLTNYWANQFSWRKAEAELNKLPQFIAQIDIEHFGNYDVHFVHQKSTIPNAIPLLFVHGWPSGFFEVMKLLPHLRGDGVTKPAFHVVSPSLIDFGFSSASRKGGFGMDQHAEAYHKLMLSLGYHEYGRPVDLYIEYKTVADTRQWCKGAILVTS